MFVNTTRMRLYGSTCVRVSDLGLVMPLIRGCQGEVEVHRHRESQVNRNLRHQLLNMSQVATMDWVHHRSPMRWPSLTVLCIDEVRSTVKGENVEDTVAIQSCDGWRRRACLLGLFRSPAGHLRDHLRFRNGENAGETRPG